MAQKVFRISETSEYCETVKNKYPMAHRWTIYYKQKRQRNYIKKVAVHADICVKKFFYTEICLRILHSYMCRNKILYTIMCKDITQKCV